VVAGSAIHGHTLNRQFNRKAPACPHTTRPGRAYQDRHPARVKAKGGGRKAEEGMGAGFHYLPHRKGRKIRKGFCLALRCFRCNILIK